MGVSRLAARRISCSNQQRLSSPSLACHPFRSGPGAVVRLIYVTCLGSWWGFQNPRTLHHLDPSRLKPEPLLVFSGARVVGAPNPSSHTPVQTLSAGFIPGRFRVWLYVSNDQPAETRHLANRKIPLHVPPGTAQDSDLNVTCLPSSNKQALGDSDAAAGQTRQEEPLSTVRKNVGNSLQDNGARDVRAFASFAYAARCEPWIALRTGMHSVLRLCKSEKTFKSLFIVEPPATNRARFLLDELVTIPGRRRALRLEWLTN
uniref:Uncharacterized protein n=1 Tax=Coccidioides posadasii RMSCC 3488 TaxID=454284 RepID=A0A0J6FJQ4_COCPO|nr:hypothetical protein CPAG_05924 [Coccidioides posadasii RMSCC 3488]